MPAIMVTPLEMTNNHQLLFKTFTALAIAHPMMTWRLTAWELAGSISCIMWGFPEALRPPLLGMFYKILRARIAFNEQFELSII